MRVSITYARLSSALRTVRQAPRLAGQPCPPLNQEPEHVRNRTDPSPKTSCRVKRALRHLSRATAAFESALSTLNKLARTKPAYTDPSNQARAETLIEGAGPMAQVVSSAFERAKAAQRVGDVDTVAYAIPSAGAYKTFADDCAGELEKMSLAQEAEAEAKKA